MPDAWQGVPTLNRNERTGHWVVLVWEPGFQKARLTLEATIARLFEPVPPAPLPE